MLDFDGTKRARRRDAILAGLILVVALLLTALSPDYERPIRNAVRSTVLRPFLASQSQIAQRRGRLADVTVVRAQRDSLAAIVAAQATLSEENRQLRSALALRGRIGDSFVPANVLRVKLTSAESTFMLDIGSAQGVYVGSPVITADGLLGRVVEVNEQTAQAVDWTNPDFRISAMTADGETYGIIEPRMGADGDERLLALTGSAFQVDVRPGRRVVSSGRGDLFPRGVPIGTVLGIEEADTGWRKSYLLRPAVRPEAAAHVLVGVEREMPDMGDIWNVTAPPDTMGGIQPDSAAGQGSN